VEYAWNAVHVNTSPVLAQFRPGESATIPVRVRIPKIFARSDMNATPGNVFTVTYNDQLIRTATRRGKTSAPRSEVGAAQHGARSDRDRPADHRRVGGPRSPGQVEPIASTRTQMNTVPGV
jgi:hypothetical protein